jgi:hypothetical protein
MKKKISAFILSLLIACGCVNSSLVSVHAYNVQPAATEVYRQTENDDEEVQTDEEESSGFYDSATQIIFSAALVFCILGIYALKRNKIL